MKKDEPSHDEEKPSNDEDGESDAEDGSSKGMAVLVSIQQPGYYKRMKAGYLGFTLFVEDGVSSYCREVPVPVSLWFRPQADSAVKIPVDILEDIDKLPPTNEA